MVFTVDCCYRPCKQILIDKLCCGMIGTMQSILAIPGRLALGVLAGIGKFSLFCAKTMQEGSTPPYYFGLIGQQIIRVGFLSLPLIGLTALFTGAVLALQIYIGGARYNAEAIVPSIVALGITRELGPVLGGLLFAGRVSAAIAAEIGAMRVSEQIAALESLAINPVKYLIIPRLVACVLSLPLLIACADSIAILGGYLIAIHRLEFDGVGYLRNTVDFLTFGDITSGLFKAAVFGFIIAIAGCYHGYFSARGADGVGRATTNAVVSASVLILVANYLLTELFFSR